MVAFDFIITLMSFVYALAMTHLLSRAGALVLARDRVAFSGLQALAMLNAILLVYADWLTTWATRTLRDWDLLSITVLFVGAVSNYFVCVAAVPNDLPSEGPIGLDAFYWKNRLLYWSVVSALNVLALPANSIFGKSLNPHLVLQTDLATLPAFVPCIVAIAAKQRWAQWVAGLGLLATTLVFMIMFDTDLR